MIEQDYLMRIIKGIAEVIAKLVLNKTSPEIEISKDNEHTEDHLLYKKLISLANHGKINEAENLLYEMDASDLKNYKVALAFYTYINEYSDDYLEECNFKRQEIESGLHDISKKFGISIYDTIAELQNFNDH